MPFIPMSSVDRDAMLAAVGVRSVDDLFEHIPSSFALDAKTVSLRSGMTESQARRVLLSLAHRNQSTVDNVSFLGAGVYDHYIPAAVDHILRRPEFYTTYTPYQAEASQGTLAALYEYQTYVCRLTGMEVANNSLYDGASALAAAVLMLHRINGRRMRVVSSGLLPNHLSVLRTYCEPLHLEVSDVPLRDGGADWDRIGAVVDGDESLCVVIQQPNRYGVVEDLERLKALQLSDRGVFLVVAADPISLGFLEPPAIFGADVVVGEGQALGNPSSFGGPLLGIFATRKEFLRHLPGRLVGATVDTLGRRGFVLTMQTREQHIRRERATSNICSNQALNALAATVYLSLIGESGLRVAAGQSHRKARYLLSRLCDVPGLRPTFARPFFKEFVLTCDYPLREVQAFFRDQGIFIGVALQEAWDNEPPDRLMMAVTENRTLGEIDQTVSLFHEFGARFERTRKRGGAAR